MDTLRRIPCRLLHKGLRKLGICPLIMHLDQSVTRAEDSDAEIETVDARSHQIPMNVCH